MRGLSEIIRMNNPGPLTLRPGFRWPVRSIPYIADPEGVERSPLTTFLMDISGFRCQQEGGILTMPEGGRKLRKLVGDHGSVDVGYTTVYRASRRRPNTQPAYAVVTVWPSAE